jgi:hypothetical protein
MKFFNSNITLKKVRHLNQSVTLRNFSATPLRRIEPGTLILTQHSMSPGVTLAVIFASYTLAAGAWLITRLGAAASDAQYIDLYPEELDDMFFFVPNYVMMEFHTITRNLSRGLDFWSNVDHLMTLTTEQAAQVMSLFDTVVPIISNIRLQCVYLTDLSDPTINGHIEFINMYIRDLDVMLEKISDIQIILAAISYI